MASNFDEQREQLVQTLRANGILDPRVLQAMGSVPRELFVDPDYANQAYLDSALPLQKGQTISQPTVVALMTEAVLMQGSVQKVLEIGTGSGYQAAILAQVADHVYTMERIEWLYEQAKQRFNRLHLTNVHCLLGDGNEGWSDHAPYDGIIVTAAATDVPEKLLDQLAEGASMVIPVGGFGAQDLLVITREGKDYHSKTIDKVVFVPMLSGTE